jgi:hypothetical protein
MKRIPHIMIAMISRAVGRSKKSKSTTMDVADLLTIMPIITS